MQISAPQHLPVRRNATLSHSLPHLSASMRRFSAAFLMPANSSALALLVHVGLARDMSEAGGREGRGGEGRGGEGRGGMTTAIAFALAGMYIYTYQFLSGLDEAANLLAKLVLQVDEPSRARLDLPRGWRVLQLRRRRRTAKQA